MNSFRIAKVIIVFSSLSYLSFTFLRNYNSPENIEKRCILKFEKDFKNNLETSSAVSYTHLTLPTTTIV